MFAHFTTLCKKGLKYGEERNAPEACNRYFEIFWIKLLFPATTCETATIWISLLQTLSWRLTRTPERFRDLPHLYSFRWTGLCSPVSNYLEGVNSISDCNIANG